MTAPPQDPERPRRLSPWSCFPPTCRGWLGYRGGPRPASRSHVVRGTDRPQLHPGRGRSRETLSPATIHGSSRRRGRSTTWPASRWASPSGSPSTPTACSGPSPTGSTSCARCASSARGRGAAGRDGHPPLRDAPGHASRARSSRACSPPSPGPARRTSSPSTWPRSSPGTWTSTPRSSKGDSFRVAVEKLYVDGRFSRYGRILAAEFTAGTAGARGRALRRRRGRRLLHPRRARRCGRRSCARPSSSRASARASPRPRFHPILNVTRPHYGVDYAAPIGTPVLAAGDGVVTSAGWLGGYGKTVRLRHPNGYETLYGHLSRIDVRAGPARRAGRRGSGTVGHDRPRHRPPPRLPHDPERRVRRPAARCMSPPAEPIPAEERAAFAQVARAERLALLSTGEPPGGPRRLERPPRQGSQQMLAGKNVLRSLLVFVPVSLLPRAHPRLPHRGLRRLLPGHPAPGRPHGRSHRAPHPPRGPGHRRAAERVLRQRGRADHRLHGPARRRHRDRQGLAHRLHHRQHAHGPRARHAPRGLEAQGAHLQPARRGEQQQHDGPGGGGAS